ncbi:MAG: hypothetical protein ACPG5B_02225 [Chitinophagales bacterium]
MLFILSCEKKDNIVEEIIIEQETNDYILGQWDIFPYATQDYGIYFLRVKSIEFNQFNLGFYNAEITLPDETFYTENRYFHYHFQNDTLCIYQNFEDMQDYEPVSLGIADFTKVKIDLSVNQDTMYWDRVHPSASIPIGLNTFLLPTN